MSACSAFAINGRFLTQLPSGVQRYASNVVHSIDTVSKGRADVPTVIAPLLASDPGLSNLSLIRTGPFTGHAWEQVTLPRLAEGRLLNLGNTAPAFRREQVVCIHDVNSFVWPKSYTLAFRTFYAALQPQLARRATRIVTVSNFSARMIARHLPIRAGEIVVLPNGHEHAIAWNADDAKIAPAVVSSRKTGDRPYVLAFGSRARHKNFELLMHIAAELEEREIDIIVGGGDHNIFSSGEVISKPNVYMTGRISDADLAYFIDHALCLAFPSWTEGFGLPIVEAMARGCPVISSNSASMPEIAGNAALFASPAEPSAWIAQIEALKLSSQLRADLIGRGYEQVKNYSWAATANGYLDLLANPLDWRSMYSVQKSVQPKMAVVIATRGRAELVGTTVRHILATQTMQPEALIVSCVSPSDAGSLSERADVRIINGPAGLAAQRNTALAALPKDTDIVVFFDDDFVPNPEWLSNTARIFRDESDIVGLTGHIVADGILGPGIPFSEALDLLSKAEPANWSWKEPFSPYGCNMAFRVSAIKDKSFDERLVLYGWLEDRDFSTSLAKSSGGRFVKTAEVWGVHMGVKSGRVSGERLGYSQIINPMYMLSKGTMNLPQVFDHVLRNVLSNFGRACWPEPYIDRRGRMRGNIIAFADLLRGRLQPERAAVLNPPARPKLGAPEMKAP